MADRETHVVNYFQTELASEFGPTALTAELLTTEGLSVSPDGCYLVVEPDVPAQREVILFNGTVGASSISTTSVANRYLAGSAETSGLTHPVGSIVRAGPLAQHVVDLNDRIDADRAAISVLDGRVTVNEGDISALDGQVAALEAAPPDHAASHLPGGSDPLNWPGGFVVARTNGPISGTVNTTTSFALFADVNLPIPASWDSWEVQMYASFHASVGSGSIRMRMLAGGVELDLRTIGAPSGVGSLSIPFGARGVDLTSTGNVNHALEILHVAGSAWSIRLRYIAATAYRTS